MLCLPSLCLCHGAPREQRVKTHKLFMFAAHFPCLRGSLPDLAFPRCCQAEQSAEEEPPARVNRRAASKPG